MKNNPKISVITACYNHGKYIPEMIASVFEQTFKEFEVIIVNDGSTDDTGTILDNIIHPSLRVIHTENHGPAYARNLAIKNATASIIMNLDADDKIEPTLLEKAYNIFQKNPDAGIVYCDADFFGSRSGSFKLEYSKENMLYDNRIISQAFFKKKDWQQIGGYSEELIYGAEDWDLWLSIMELEKDIIKIPETLVHYRTYNNLKKSRSGKRRKSRIQILTTLVIIFRRHRKLYSAYPKAWKHFSHLEDKLKNEHCLVKMVKNLYFNYLKNIRFYG